MRTHHRLAALLLSAVLLVCAVPFSASAADTVSFIPKLNGGKIYGVPAESPIADIEHVYFNCEVKVYDKNKTQLKSEDTVCTGQTVKINGASYTAVVMGDIDGDGSITPYDYVMIKRAYFETMTISNYAKEASTCDAGDKLRSIHYLMVKRAYFGTFNINNAYTCDPYDPDEGEDGWSDGWV